MNTTGGERIGGTFLVNGNVNLATDVIFSSKDLNQNPGLVQWRWSLMSWTGTAHRDHNGQPPAQLDVRLERREQAAGCLRALSVTS